MQRKQTRANIQARWKIHHFSGVHRVIQTHTQISWKMTSCFPFPYTKVTPSLPNVVTSLVDFLTAYKSLWHLCVIARASNSKNPELYYLAMLHLCQFVWYLTPPSFFNTSMPQPSYPSATPRKNPFLPSIRYVIYEQSLSKYAVQLMLKLTRSFFMSSNQRIFRLASSLYFQASYKQYLNFFFFYKPFLHLQLQCWAFVMWGTAFLVEWLSPGHCLYLIRSRCR